MQNVLNEHVARTTTALLQVAVACWAYISATRPRARCPQHNYVQHEVGGLARLLGLFVAVSILTMAVVTMLYTHISICIACVRISSSFDDRRVKSLRVLSSEIWRCTARVTSEVQVA